MDLYLLLSSRLKALDTESLPTHSYGPCVSAAHPSSHSPPCLTWSTQAAAASVGASPTLEAAGATPRLLNQALLT